MNRVVLAFMLPTIMLLWAWAMLWWSEIIWHSRAHIEEVKLK